MTEPAKPATPAPKPEPRLVSVTFPTPLTLTNLNPTAGIHIGTASGQWSPESVVVTSDAVFLRVPGTDTVIELQRTACVLRWSIGEQTVSDAVAVIRKGGR